MHKYAQLVLLASFLTACSPSANSPTTLHVGAAANLARVFPRLASACRKSTGLTLIPSLASTAQLTQQIENGGPYDLFLAADRAHVVALDNGHKLIPESVHNYAQGRLVLYAPRRADITSLADLKLASVKKIGVAKPELAPYGEATIQTLTRLNLWPEVEKKVVYGQNISAVLQFVDSSNVDCAFTALALIYDNPGHKITVDPSLHAPIDQALGIPSTTTHPAEAKKAAAWFVSNEARAIFTEAGYGPPQ